MNKKKPKTRASALKAARKYDAGFDKVDVRLPKGSKEKIKERGYDSMNRFAREAIEYRFVHPELEAEFKAMMPRGKEEESE